MSQQQGIGIGKGHHHHHHHSKRDAKHGGTSKSHHVSGNNTPPLGSSSNSSSSEHGKHPSTLGPAPKTHATSSSSTTASMNNSTATVSSNVASVPSQQLWGELEYCGPSVSHKFPVRPLWQEGWKATSVSCTVPRLYVPPVEGKAKDCNSNQSASMVALDFPRDRNGHNLMLHYIELQRYLQEFEQLASALSSEQEEASRVLANPPIPTTFWKHECHKFFDVLSEPRYKIPRLCLDQKSLAQLMQKSVATICAHTGYERSSSIALDTLANVMEDFLTKFCKLLRVNMDQSQENGNCGFQDVLEQTLHQCGVGGRRALHRHWVHGVKNPALRLHQAALDRLEDCKRKLTESSKASAAPISRVSVSSLPLQRPREPVELRMISPWPVSSVELGGSLGTFDEEIPLEGINLDNVMPTKTPDFGGQAFSQFADNPTPDQEGFAPLTLDGPPRKRLRTSSLHDL